MLSRPALSGCGGRKTWIVGFALIADLYGPEERAGMGLAMAGSSLGSSSAGACGWLYEIGGIVCPFCYGGVGVAD